MKKKRIPLDTVMAVVIILMILVLAGYGLLAQQLPLEAVRFPLFVFGVVVCAGAGEIFHSLRAQKREEGTEAPEPPPVFYDRKRFLLVCGMIVGYLLAMYLFGFILSTILFAVVFAWQSQFRPLVPFCAVAVAAAVGLSFCFTRLMFIHLPQGILLELIL